MCILESWPERRSIRVWVISSFSKGSIPYHLHFCRWKYTLIYEKEVPIVLNNMLLLMLFTSSNTQILSQLSLILACLSVFLVCTGICLCVSKFFSIKKWSILERLHLWSYSSRYISTTYSFATEILEMALSKHEHMKMRLQRQTESSSWIDRIQTPSLLLTYFFK